jgi:hypothetical protein
VIVLAMAMACIMCAGLIVSLVLLLARAERERDRLVNLLASRTPHEFSVIQRASAAPAQAPKPERDEPRAPKFAVGL